MPRQREIDFPREEWLSWEDQVYLSGYIEEYSVIALRLFLLILFTPDLLEKFTESTERGYNRAYYKRYKERIMANRKKRRDQLKQQGIG